MKGKKISLALQIFIALILAIIVGLLMQNHKEIANGYIKPFGTIFLNLLKFIVCPIVFFSKDIAGNYDLHAKGSFLLFDN